MEVLEAFTSYKFGKFKTNVSAGIHITDHPLLVRIQYKALEKDGLPTVVLYDAADARYHLENDHLAQKMDFVEFGTIGGDNDK